MNRNKRDQVNVRKDLSCARSIGKFMNLNLLDKKKTIIGD